MNQHSFAARIAVGLLPFVLTACLEMKVVSVQAGKVLQALGLQAILDEDTIYLGQLKATGADSVQYSMVQSGQGTVTITNSATGDYKYVPPANFSGSDSFRYRASDGKSDSIAEVTLTIRPVNDPPIASNLSISVKGEAAVSGNLTATDIDSPSLTYAIVAQPAKGSVSLTATTGAFVYTPNAAAQGTDTFTFRANDGKADSNVATVTVLLNSDNQRAVLQISDGPSYTFPTDGEKVGTMAYFHVTNIGELTATGMGGTVTNVSTDGAFTFAGGYPGGSGASSFCGSTLKPGAECAVAVSYWRPAPGSHTGVFSITYNDGAATRSVDRTVFGVTTARAILNFFKLADPPGNELVTTFDFGDVAFGAPQVAAVQMRNVGHAPATDIGISIGSSPFGAPGEAPNGACGTTLDAGANCVLGFQINDSAAGQRSGQVSVTYPTSLTSTLGLKATSKAPAHLVFSPNPTDFGTHPVGAAIELPITVTNTGAMPATDFVNAAFGVGPGAQPAPFQWKGGNGFPGTGSSCGTSIAAGASCNAIAVFKPVVPGSFQTDLIIGFHNGGANPSASLHVQGVGTSPIDISPSLVDFGTRLVGKTATLVVAVTNRGSSALESLSITAPNAPFVSVNGEGDPAQNPCSGELAAGASCKITVKFTPVDNSTSSDQFQLNYTDGGTPASLAIRLRGAGGDCSTVGFGNGGSLELAVPGKSLRTGALVQQPDGKIVVAATVSDFNGPTGWMVRMYRLECDGSPDATFGQGGTVVTDFNGWPIGVGLLGDGRILVVGDTGWMLRFRTDGGFDETFGIGGKIPAVGFQQPDGVAEVTDLLVNPDGSSFLGGAKVGAANAELPTIWRRNADGSAGGRLVFTDQCSNGRISSLSQAFSEIAAAGTCDNFTDNPRAFAIRSANLAVTYLFHAADKSEGFDYRILPTGMPALMISDRLLILGPTVAQLLPRLNGSVPEGFVLGVHPTGRAVIAARFAEGAGQPAIGLLGAFDPSNGTPVEAALEQVHLLTAYPGYYPQRLYRTADSRTLILGLATRSGIDTLVLMRVRDTLELDNGQSGCGGGLPCGGP